MIAKITKSTSFHNLVNYVLDSKKSATLIDSCGVLTLNHQSIIKSFDVQAKLNPRLTSKVGHISISFHKNDLPQLTDTRMVEIAQDYLNKMGIMDTQYIIGQHFDKENPHFHIVFNRVNNFGKTISDKNDFRRSEKICKELKIKYGLYFSEGKKDVKIHRLREPDKSRHEIYAAITEALPNCKDWTDLVLELDKQDISMRFKYKRGSNEAQGVSFSKGKYVFSGSQVDRGCSYLKISQAIESNIDIGIETQRKLEEVPEVPTSHFVPYLRHEDEEDSLMPQTRKKRKNNKNKGLSL